MKYNYDRYDLNKFNADKATFWQWVYVAAIPIATVCLSTALAYIIFFTIFYGQKAVESFLNYLF